MAIKVEPIRTVFARHGLRCTSQRTAIYDALRATTRHPTAEELYHEVKPRTSSLSLATVYSTLEAFSRVGLAQRIPTTDGACRFDADTSDHVHLWMDDDQTVRDLPCDLSVRIMASIPDDLVDEIEDRMGVRVRGVDVHLSVAGTDDPGRNGQNRQGPTIV
jgi:Fe2+ or Zn2+ uptake regulation protein